eukprot:2912244-Prymnesium_polylepis.1
MRWGARQHPFARGRLGEFALPIRASGQSLGRGFDFLVCRHRDVMKDRRLARSIGHVPEAVGSGTVHSM